MLESATWTWHSVLALPADKIILFWAAWSVTYHLALSVSNATRVSLHHRHYPVVFSRLYSRSSIFHHNPLITREARRLPQRRRRRERRSGPASGGDCKCSMSLWVLLRYCIIFLTTTLWLSTVNCSLCKQINNTSKLLIRTNRFYMLMLFVFVIWWC